jgi:nucleotide-binding universal stress UspA family protein
MTKPTGRYRRILVPLDGSGWSQRALPHAMDIARSNGSEIVLLNVFAAPAQAFTPELALAGQQTAVRDMREWAMQYLQGVAREVREQSIPVKLEVVDSADIPTAICDYATTEDIDLIVMSTHGRTGISRLLFGSVARAVMEHIDVPILLVHPHKEGEAQA